MRYIKLILSLITLLVLLLFGSNFVSNKSAKKLVGDTLDYCQLSETRLAKEPFEGSQIVWSFKFSRPGSFDEEFYIYTNLLGNVVVTIPSDLEERLRKLEKMDPYPYTKLRK